MGEFHQAIGPDEIIFERLFGQGTGMRGPLGYQLFLQHVFRGIHLHRFQLHQHLALCHLLSFPHKDGVHDAAFQMLDGLALAFHLDLAGSDHGTAYLAPEGPGAKYAKEEQDHCHPLAYDAAGIFYGAVFPAAGGLIFTVAAARLAGRDFYRGDAGDGAPCGLQGRILFGGRIRHCRRPPAFFAGLPAVSAMPVAGGLSFPAACGPERPVPAGGAWRPVFPARPDGDRKGLSGLPA